MNLPRNDEAGEAAKRFAALPRIPSDETGPVFQEPWQATAFALVVQLHAAGAFSWPEWADALATELKAADLRGEADDGALYYEHWLAALERLIGDRGLIEPTLMSARKEAWADAYRRTPPGSPVEL